jgi:hypothetical protein
MSVGCRVSARASSNDGSVLEIVWSEPVDFAGHLINVARIFEPHCWQDEPLCTLATYAEVLSTKVLAAMAVWAQRARVVWGVFTPLCKLLHMVHF